MGLFANPAYGAVAIMLALVVLTPWAFWEAEQLRASLRQQRRAVPPKSRRGR
jgi:hypothetical protein